MNLSKQVTTMAHYKLIGEATPDKLIAMGFTDEDDGTGDPRGIDWNFRNDKFHVWVDPWGEVFMSRINPDTDPITVECE